MTPPAASSDTLSALAQLAAAMPPPPPDPLAVSRALAEAADLRAWLSTRDLAALLGVSASTIR